LKLNRWDLRVTRTMLGLTQKNVAFLIDKTHGYVSQLEAGTKPITDKVEDDLKRAFKLDEEVHQAVRVLSDRLKEIEEGK
jgi:predicted transcriptional regulator